MLYIVSLHTPLEKLPEFKGLSTRAQNICRRPEVQTVGRLMAIPDELLLRYRNCGTRCLNELQGIKMKYAYLLTEAMEDPIPTHHDNVMANPQFWHNMTRFLDRYYTSLPAETASLLRRFAGDVREFVDFLWDDTSTVAGRISGFTWVEFESLRQYLGGFLSAAADEVSYYDMDFNCSELRIEGMVREAPLEMARCLLAGYPSVVKVNLDIYYKACFDKLPTRVRNVFTPVRDWDSCLPYLTGAVPLEQRTFSGCGAGSFRQFLSFFEHQRERFVNTLVNLEPNRSPEYYLDEYCVRCSNMYPFLSIVEQEYLARLEMEGKEKPWIGIWRKYVKWHPSERAAIMCDRFGLRGGDSMQYYELGEKYGMTGERIRQICHEGMPEDVLISTVREKVAAYMDRIVIGEFDPVWQGICAKEGIEGSARELMGLVSLTRPDYEVMMLGGRNGVACLIDISRIDRKMVREVLEKAGRDITGRLLADAEVDVTGIVKSVMESVYGADEVEALTEVVRSAMEQLYGAERRKGGKMLLRRNVVSRTERIERILEDCGKPMTLGEIHGEYLRLYQDDALRGETSVHSYLLRSERVTPLGKRGLYALRGWDNVYGGCIKDYIPEVLAASDEPMTADRIAEEVRRHFPDTNEKSVTSLIYLDEGKYVMFTGGAFGLAGKEYPGWESRQRKVARRETFEARFAAFRDFVEREGRCPYVNDNPEESSLNRWRENVMKERVEVKPEQRRALGEYLAALGEIPTHGLECKFADNCRKVREYVERYGAMPKAGSKSKEYAWFNRSLRRRGTWGDNRDKYFEDLLEWLAGNSLFAGDID